MLGWVVLALCCAASVVHAQDEDINILANSYSTFQMIIETLVISAAYLLLYAAALVVPLIFLQRFDGFEPALLLWIGVLWAGGMVINAVLFALLGEQHRVIVVLLALPLLFGWSYFLGTRTWTDLLPETALRVALVVALVCPPYFGPTWRIHPPKPVALESRLVIPADADVVPRAMRMAPERRAGFYAADARVSTILRVT